MPDLVRLNEADGAAADAYLASRARGAGFGPIPPGSSERVAAVLGLFSLLDHYPVDEDGSSAPDTAASDAPDEALIRTTLSRVEMARDAKPLAVAVTPLSEADGQVLEAVMTGRGEPGPVPPGELERAEKLRGVLSLLDQLSLDPAPQSSDDRAPTASDLLIRRTLDAAAEQRQRERFAQQIELFSEPRRTLGVSLRQILTAAAVFVLGISLLMPAIERSRAEAQQVACATNLGIAGQQISAYAMDHAGMLPRGPVGASWLKTGQPDAIDDAGRYQSNSAHLYLLIRQGYTAAERLACASNRQANVGGAGVRQLDWGTPQAVSYSYQNQHGASPIRLDRSMPSLAILADKNPLFVVRRGKIVFDAEAKPDARSSLHRSRGQNILTLDGRVRWSKQPKIGDDNVWQIRGHHGGYIGNEAPLHAGRDSFLVP
ncbi:MAG: hypothetical protein AAGG38_05070 [Planctomycetota bacterium]